MAHFLSRPPTRPQDTEILLSSFTHVALQVDAQKKLLRSERVRSRRGKKGQKKQPQRGLGVAQLEKLRVEEQTRQEAAARLVAFHVQGQATYPLLPASPFERENSKFLPQNSAGCTSAVLCLAPSPDRAGAFSPKCQRYEVTNGFKAPFMEMGANSSWITCNGKGNSRYSHKRHYDDTAFEDHCGGKLHMLSGKESEVTCSSIHSVIQLQHGSRGVLHRQSSCFQSPAVRPPPPLDRMKELSSFQSVFPDSTAATNEMVHIKRRACASVQGTANDLVFSDLNTCKPREVISDTLPVMGAGWNNRAGEQYQDRSSIMDNSICSLSLSINECKGLEPSHGRGGGREVCSEMRLGPPGESTPKKAETELFPLFKGQMITASQPLLDEKKRCLELDQTLPASNRRTSPRDFLALAISNSPSLTYKEAGSKDSFTLPLSINPGTSPAARSSNVCGGCDQRACITTSTTKIKDISTGSDARPTLELQLCHRINLPAKANGVQFLQSGTTPCSPVMMINRENLRCKDSNANSESIDLTLKL